MDQKTPRAKIAASQPRSSGGRFAPKAKAEVKGEAKPSQSKPFETPKFLKSSSSYHLRDIVRIAVTAFVVIILSTTGIQHAVCDKGVQTEVGTVKVLKAKNVEHGLDGIKNLFLQRPNVADTERIVLFNPKNEAILLLGDPSLKLKEQDNKRVFVTGHYNSCKNRMYVPSAENIEPLQ